MKKQINTGLVFSTLVFAFLAGCGDSTPDEYAHGAGEPEHAHDEPEMQVEVVTDYTPASELFVEFPTLLIGQDSRFAAHVTRLDNFEPVRSGRMDVVLRRESRTVARFRVDQPARAGLFTPTITPREVGEFELVIEVETPGMSVVHELGRFTVFANPGVARVTTEAPTGEIGYLKEQQWSVPFSTTVARPVLLRESVPGTAVVRAPADGGARVIAPDDGYFTAFNVPRAGQHIEAGDVLGYLVPRLGEGNDIGRLLVELDRARSRVGLAVQDLERLETLFGKGAVPERRVIEARAELDVAESEFNAARGRIEQRQGGRASGGASEAGIALRAPVSGEIIDVAVSPGAFVRAGEALLWLAEPGRRWLEIRVPEAHASHLKRASAAWLETPEGTVVLDAQRGAHVVQVAGRVDPVSRTVAVTIEYPVDDAEDSVPRPPTLVGQGLEAHVLLASAGERLAVPRGALIDDGGRLVVFVQTGGETFERRPVETGIRDGDWIEIVTGIEAGERVVSIGAWDVRLAATGGDEVGHGHAH